MTLRMDRAVTAAYEPGSTFKVITLTGAIENGVARPADLVDCQMGSILVAGRLIHDWHPFGMLSVARDPGAFERRGLDQDCAAAGRAEFLSDRSRIRHRPAHGIELPGENRGLLRPLENWTASSIGSMAMGQEVSVTPVQIISAISAIANGGLLYRPHRTGNP